jgi:hypothetical protein
MPRTSDSEDAYASESQEESESEYVESSVELSDGSQVVNLASPRASAAALAANAALDDDDDVQILTPTEVAAELAAAARRAIADPEGVSSRKRKRPAVETKAQPTECTICCEDCTLVGDHRLVALRCGHLFGKKCIERWIGERRTCPNCNAGVQRADVLTLFSDHVAVVDNSGLEDMTTKFEAEKQKKSRLEKELAVMKQQLNTKTSETVRLSGDLNKFKRYFADLRLRLEQKQRAQAVAATTNAHGQADASAALLAMSNNMPGPVANVLAGGAAVQVSPSQSQTSSQGASPSAQPRSVVLPAVPTQPPPAERSVDALTAAIGKYKPVFDVPLLSARVFGIASSCRFLCVGEKLADGSHGILMMSSEDPRRRRRVAVHSSYIRDLCFQQANTQVLTVAFDGKLAVTNLRDQKVAIQVELPPGRRQGWSCSFSETDPNAMFCGFQDGTVAQYDMRKPAGGEQGVVKNFALPESQPVHSLKVFKSRDSTASLAAATFRGLSIWRGVAQGSQPVAGNGLVRATPFCHATFSQACYSLASNQLNPSQMVVSTRSTPVLHSLFNLRTLQSGQLRPSVEFASHQAPSVLSRSALWSEADGTSILASWAHDIERVSLIDVATFREARGPEPSKLSTASSSMPVVDIQHAVANGTWNSGTALLGTMTSRQLCLYRRTR